MYQVSTQTRLARSILRQTFRGLFHILARVRIQGKENVPKNGPYLVVMNHVSIYDPPFLISFWPSAPEVIAAIEIWSKPGQSKLVQWYGAIPVHRSAYDRKVIETMVQVLESGLPMVIAPEGGRSHTPGMKIGHPGVAYILNCNPVPVVPVGIVGTTDDFFEHAIRGSRPTLEMKIGRPILIPKIEGNNKAARGKRQENVDLLMYEIAALLPPEYQGAYTIENRNDPKTS